MEGVLSARILGLLNVQATQLVQHRSERGVFAAEEFLADGERLGEEWTRLRFPCRTGLPRELPEIEEGGGELPPEPGIAARRDYCGMKAFGGSGLVSRGQCGARCIEPLGEQRFSVSHVHTLP